MINTEQSRRFTGSYQHNIGGCWMWPNYRKRIKCDLWRFTRRPARNLRVTIAVSVAGRWGGRGGSCGRGWVGAGRLWRVRALSYGQGGGVGHEPAFLYALKPACARCCRAGGRERGRRRRPCAATRSAISDPFSAFCYRLDIKVRLTVRLCDRLRSTRPAARRTMCLHTVRTMYLLHYSASSRSDRLVSEPPARKVACEWLCDRMCGAAGVWMACVIAVCQSPL